MTEGPRVQKLKQVYKKAIQKILEEESTIKQILTDPADTLKDSFYTSDTCKQKDTETDTKIDKLFRETKTRILEAFKAKFDMTLEERLNSLDKDIKEKRTSNRDIAAEDYIMQIYESHIVDKKVDFINFLEEIENRSALRLFDLKNELESLKARLNVLKNKNSVCENNYNELINRITLLMNKN